MNTPCCLQWACWQDQFESACPATSGASSSLMLQPAQIMQLQQLTNAAGVFHSTATRQVQHKQDLDAATSP